MCGVLEWKILYIYAFNIEQELNIAFMEVLHLFFCFIYWQNMGCKSKPASWQWLWQCYITFTFWDDFHNAPGVVAQSAARSFRTPHLKKETSHKTPGNEFSGDQAARSIGGPRMLLYMFVQQECQIGPNFSKIQGLNFSKV